MKTTLQEAITQGRSHSANRRPGLGRVPRAVGQEPGFVVALAALPHAEENPQPDVRQRPQGGVMLMAPGSVLVIVLAGPGTPR